MWAFYSTAMAGIAVCTGLLLKRFAAPKVSPLSLGTTAVAWLTALSVVALVPIDVYATLSRQEVPAISTLWSISYWSTQVLTWAVIPMLQGYSISGSFTIWGRFVSALKRNLIFYAVVGTLAVIGILIAWLSGHLALRTLPGLVFTLSNTYGLIVCILLLGYGLVEIPRVLWRRSFPEKRLCWHYHRVGRAAEKLTDASAELEKVLAIVLATSQQVPRTDTQLRPYVELLLEYTDDYSPVKLSMMANKVDMDKLEEGDLDYATGVDMLAKLRGRLKQAIGHFVGCRSEYVSYVKKALELEALCKARQHRMYTPPSGNTSRAAVAWWWYKCEARAWVQKLAAAVAAVVSLALVWSEATIYTGTSPDLSPFSLLIHSGFAMEEFMNQALVALPLAYICGCAYFSLFKLGNFGFYHMVGHATWAYSLLLSGSLLCRFAAPLCFNFLHVIRMNEYLNGGEQMVFIQKMKGMNDVPVLGHSFNTWFPVTITIYCALLTFNLWEQCCSRIFVSSRFRFDTERADDEHTSRGQRLVQMEQEAMTKGYPLGDGIGLFGVGSSELVTGGGPGSPEGGDRSGRPPRPGSSMELNASLQAKLAARGKLGSRGSGTRIDASSYVPGSGALPGPQGAWANTGSFLPDRPNAWGSRGSGSASLSGAGRSDSLGNDLLSNRHGSSTSLASMHGSKSGGALAAAGSQHGSPLRPGQQQGAFGGSAAGAGAGDSSDSAIDSMFAAVDSRRGRAQDSQRLVDASAENSSGGGSSVLGFASAWRRTGR